MEKQIEETLDIVEESVIDEPTENQMSAEELRIEELVANFTPDHFIVGNGEYRLVKDYRDAFDYRKLLERYHDILNKYDYIVGDWGYDQLRLKGFFKDDFRNAAIDAKIGHLEDYLYEYCNFGCAYFVIEQTGEFQRKGRDTSPGRPRNKNKNKNKNQAHTEERRKDVKRPKKKPKFKKKVNEPKPKNEKKPVKKEPKQGQQKKNSFVIRQKDN